MGHKSTEDINEMLKSRKSFGNFIEENQDEFIDTSLSQDLSLFISKTSLSLADVARLSGVEKSYVSGIFSGKRKNPSRDRLLAICLAMQLSLDEVKALLKNNSYPPLYPRIIRDSVISYALVNRHSLSSLNSQLLSLNLPILDVQKGGNT